MKTFDDKILAQIDAYILDEMTPEELKAFEKILSSDPYLREELILQQSMHDSFRDTNRSYDKNDLNNPNVQDVIQQLKSEKYQSISSSIKSANKQYQNESKKIISIKKRNYLLISSAIVLTLLFCSTFLFNNNNNNLEQIYKQYAVHDDIHLVQKSNGTSSSATIEKQFNNKDYQNAYTNLSIYIKTNPTDTKAKLALGICALETNKIEEASEVFNNIMNGSSSLKHYGTWYLALSNIKIGDKKNTKLLLEKIPKSEYQIYTKAKELLSKI